MFPKRSFYVFKKLDQMDLYTLRDNIYKCFYIFPFKSISHDDVIPKSS